MGLAAFFANIIKNLPWVIFDRCDDLFVDADAVPQTPRAILSDRPRDGGHDCARCRHIIPAGVGLGDLTLVAACQAAQMYAVEKDARLVDLRG